MTAPTLHVKWKDEERTLCGRVIPSGRQRTNPDSQVCKTCMKLGNKASAYFGHEYVDGEWRLRKAQWVYELTACLVEKTAS